MTLKNDTPVLTYSGVGRSESVSRIHQVLEAMTAAVGGNFVTNPAWTLLGKQEVTVHPMYVPSLLEGNRDCLGLVNVSNRLETVVVLV
jgi:hypothetical protein